MRTNWPSLTLPAALLLCALGGCADTSQAPLAGATAEGPAPTTARALAYVAATYAGTPQAAVRERDAAEEFASAGIGTELRYRYAPEQDGDLLTVATGRGLDPALFDCGTALAEYLAGCVQTDQGTLMWQEETPDEDPGGVYVVVVKGESAVLLFYSGPSITGDPRELELPISTEVMFAIADDPRVDTTTSAEAVAAGADLTYWLAAGG